MMTEEEAKTKWCPFIRIFQETDYPAITNRCDVPTSAAGINCIGSACMAWRWDCGADFRLRADTAFKRTGERISPTHGYCGLAGRPA